MGGVVFLVYLLYKTQYNNRFAVPVSVAVLDRLASLREECESQKVLLECPHILHSLVTDGAFSVGAHASYRNFFFSPDGELTERRSCDPAALDEIHLQRKNVQSRRLQIKTKGESNPPTPNPPTPNPQTPVIAAQNGREVIDCPALTQEAMEYAAAHPMLAEKKIDGTSCSRTPERVGMLGCAAARYGSTRLPEPRSIQLAEGVTALDLKEPKRSKRSRTPAADTGGSEEELDEPKPKSTRPKPQSRLLGMDKLLARQQK